MVVTLSNPNETSAFCTERAPGIDCFSDIGADAYRAFGLTRISVQKILSPSVVGAGIKALAEGHRQGATQGDGLQMPGTFVISSTGMVTFAYYSSNVSDYPRAVDLLQAVQATN